MNPYSATATPAAYIPPTAPPAPGLGFVSIPQAPKFSIDWKWVLIAALSAWIIYQATREPPPPPGKLERRVKGRKAKAIARRLDTETW